MNEDTLQTVEAWRHRGDDVAVATVVRTYRSAPAPARLHVRRVVQRRDGRLRLGRLRRGRGLRRGPGAVRRRGHARSSCTTASPTTWPGTSASPAAASSGWRWIERRERPALRRGAIALVVTGEQAGRRLVLDADTGALEGDDRAATCGRRRRRRRARPWSASARARSTSRTARSSSSRASTRAPRMVVVGAVDTSEAVCKMANILGWRTVVIDPRAKFATRERLPSAQEIVVDWPDEAYERIGLRARRLRDRPDARSEGRRPGHQRGAAARGVVRRRPRLAPHAGQAPRAAARVGRPRGRPRSRARPGGSRHRRRTRRRRRRSPSSPR